MPLLSLLPTALLLPLAHALLGCRTTLDSGTEYYTCPSGSCCSPEYAAVTRDVEGAISDIRCGSIRFPYSTNWIDEVPLCHEQLKWTSTCRTIILKPEVIPPHDSCSVHVEPRGIPAEGEMTDTHEKACYNGRVFFDGESCCTLDFVTHVERSVRCGWPQGLLDADNRPPALLSAVDKCGPETINSRCFRGVRSSRQALLRGTMCTGCCPDGYTRDSSFRCRPQFYNLFTLRNYWAARQKDGCELPKLSAHCCHDRRQFRDEQGFCSHQLNKQVATRSEVYVRRNERDGCVDFLDGLV
ncbi:hypothetical protein GQ602_006301 [Ophiocordyceps camponoti-floridani]|uniref:Uncharacterized protein n=1 Tax=Ophiocordyceps camponoti-floridani TaxID=2030778 RepID=A0A8H4Q2Z0_9HYPO|nr:hypothetical protein GQ602_006301 [Ophiocordyceps camponoti-floridani]